MDESRHDELVDFISAWCDQAELLQEFTSPGAGRFGLWVEESGTPGVLTWESSDKDGIRAVDLMQPL